MKPRDHMAMVSCHVENVFDEEIWLRYLEFIASPPGGSAVASLVRPPVPGEQGDRDLWLARAREAACFGPLGHHTHFGGAGTARPVDNGVRPADRVRREAEWLRDADLAPEFFCGGGWYMDRDVMAVLADFSYVDCTATTRRPGYLTSEDPTPTLCRPAWVKVERDRSVLEIPTTHSIGAYWRAALRRRLPLAVHLYFHDYDLLDSRRLAALTAAMRSMSLKRRGENLKHYAMQAGAAASAIEWSSIGL